MDKIKTYKIDVPFFPYQDVFCIGINHKITPCKVLGYRYVDKKLNSIEVQKCTEGAPLEKVSPNSLFWSYEEASNFLLSQANAQIESLHSQIKLAVEKKEALLKLLEVKKDEPIS